MVSVPKKTRKPFTSHILRLYPINARTIPNTMKSIEEHELPESANDNEKVRRVEVSLPKVYDPVVFTLLSCMTDLLKLKSCSKEPGSKQTFIAT